MSKIGRLPIAYDNSKTKVTVEKGGEYGNVTVTVNGPKGELSFSVRKGIKIEVGEKEIVVARNAETKQLRAFHGLYRSLLENNILGVNEGFQKRLEIHGVGYRGANKGNGIELNIGFSHPVYYEPPEDVQVRMEDQNLIVVSGNDKQRVGQIAATIRGLRPPEPYKGKGIRYEGERVRRKAGKANIS